MNHLPYLAAVYLMLIGLYGIATSRNLVHLILCLTVVQSSTYLLLLGVGYRNNATAPIYQGLVPGHRAVDPVVQALTLTDIVVEATVVALLLALTVVTHKRFGSLDPQDLRPMRG